jgi:hypothetical protein
MYLAMATREYAKFEKEISIVFQFKINLCQQQLRFMQQKKKNNKESVSGTCWAEDWVALMIALEYKLNFFAVQLIAIRQTRRAILNSEFRYFVKEICAFLRCDV